MSDQTPPNDSNRSHDLFQDPALSQTLQDDPVAKFLVSNFKGLLILVLAALCALYLRSQFQQTSDVRLAEASETFERVRTSVDELQKINEKAAQSPSSSATPEPTPDVARVTRSAQDSLEALKSGPEPYSLMAPMYADLLAVNRRDLKVEDLSKSSTDQALQTVQSTAWRETNSIEKRLILELQALAATRRLLDQEDTFERGFASLTLLAQESSYVRPSATLTLLRIASTPEQKASALVIAQEVSRLFPEQAEKLDIEIKRLS